MLSHIFDTQFLLRLLRYPLGVLIAGLLMKGFWKLVEMEQPKEGYVSLPKSVSGDGAGNCGPNFRGGGLFNYRQERLVYGLHSGDDLALLGGNPDHDVFQPPGEL